MKKAKGIVKATSIGAGLLLAGAILRRTRNFAAIAPDLRIAPMRLRTPSVGPRSLKIWRAVAGVATRPDPKVTMSSYQVPTTGGGTIKVFVYRPRSLKGSRPALLYVHGGGMIFGTAAATHARASRYAAELGIVTVSPDYRLAPEHPFPAALDDVEATYRWMMAEARNLAIDEAKLVVAGESAGGGLAASLCQRLLDRTVRLPLLQLLIYPMLDDRTTVRKVVEGRGQLIWTASSNQFAWQSYIGGDPADSPVPEYASPARRTNLTGLPPAWIGVGTLDLFFEEDLEYASRLEAAGVSCELVTVDGAFHGFDMLGGKHISQTFTASTIDAVGRAVGLRG